MLVFPNEEQRFGKLVFRLRDEQGWYVRRSGMMTITRETVVLISDSDRLTSTNLHPGVDARGIDHRILEAVSLSRIRHIHCHPAIR